VLSPFITAGIGIGNYGKGSWAPYVPLGGGLQVNMFGEVYIFLQANCRRSLVASKLDHNMFYSIGLLNPLDAKRKRP